MKIQLEVCFLLKVLIIDDDVNSTDILKTTLENTQFEVLTAALPEQGIKAIREHQPDAVILDFIMPGMKGIEVCQAIRQFSQVPILVLSVIDQPSVIANVLDSGADDYLVKPVAGNVLQAYLKKMARRNPASKPKKAYNYPLKPN
jgi:DNA-binding response OmpR family regulator